jgi:transcriptional regulator with XRE-family HTH domain
MNNLVHALRRARRQAKLTQEELAGLAGLTRMTVQRLESGKLDPRFSTLQEVARVLGMDIMLVPSSLRTELQGFVRSGGRMLGQAPGADAPPSLVDILARGTRTPPEDDR